VGHAVNAGAGTIGALRQGSHLEQLEALHRAVGAQIEAERRRVLLGNPTPTSRNVVKPRRPLPGAHVIRAWAIENGHMTAVRGPIPSDVVDAYRLEVLEVLEVTP